MFSIHAQVTKEKRIQLPHNEKLANYDEQELINMLCKCIKVKPPITFTNEDGGENYVTFSVSKSVSGHDCHAGDDESYPIDTDQLK